MSDRYGTLNHPAMFHSVVTLGSLVMDVDGETLDLTFLDVNGQVEDHFTIEKGLMGTWDDLGGGNAGGA